MPKISALPPLTTPDAADEVAIVDTSAGTTKKILISDLGNNGEWLSDGAVERGGLTAAALVSDATGHGFLEIARTTLGSEGDTITVSSIPARKYLLFLFYGNASGGTLDTVVRFNNIATNSYAFGHSASFAAATTEVSQPGFPWESGATDSGGISVGRLEVTANIATEEKSFNWLSISQDAAGAATLPVQLQGYGKFVDTTNQITRIDWTNAGTGNFAVGSEIVVLGKD